MGRYNLDFGKMKIGPLFRALFFPTLIGMFFTSLITVIDDMFVGHGVGADGIASVNIVAPTFMVATGIGLMFGIGSSAHPGVAVCHDTMYRDDAHPSRRHSALCNVVSGTSERFSI